VTPSLRCIDCILSRRGAPTLNEYIMQEVPGIRLTFKLPLIAGIRCLRLIHSSFDSHESAPPPSGWRSVHPFLPSSPVCPHTETHRPRHIATFVAIGSGGFKLEGLVGPVTKRASTYLLCWFQLPHAYFANSFSYRV